MSSPEHAAVPPIVVATLLRDAGPTGVQSHVRSLLTYLSEHSYESDLITPFLAPRLLFYPFLLVRRPLSMLCGACGVWWYRHWHAGFTQWLVSRRLRSGTPCIVYAQCPLSAKAALAARRNEQQRVYMVVHFNISQADEWEQKGLISKGGTLWKSIRAGERAILPQLDGLVFVSRFMRQCLLNEIPEIGALPFTVVPNTCSPGFQTGDHSIPIADVINVGTLEPRKNQQFLLKVIAHAARRGHPYSLMMVGDGPDKSKLLALAKSLGIENQVSFMGFRHDVPALLEKARVYAHSATAENLPVAIVEAMAAGLPVLAIPAGGIGEMFDDGMEGVYWSPDEVAAAAEALIGVLENPSTLQRMGNNSRLRYSAQYSESSVLKRLLAFLTRDFS